MTASQVETYNGVVVGKVGLAERDALMDQGRIPRFELDQPFAPEEFDARMRGLQEEIARRELDAMIIVGSHSTYYLFGLDALPGTIFFQIIVVPAGGDPVAVVRYLDTPLARQSGRLQDVRAIHEDETPHEVGVRVLQELGLASSKRLGIELNANTMTPLMVDAFRAGVRSHGGDFVEASDLVLQLRVHKSPAEVEQLRHAAALSDLQFDAAFTAMKPGARECEVAAAALYAGHTAGADAAAVPVLLSSGMNTLLWTHLGPQRKEIRAGEFVLMETATSFNQYHVIAGHTVVCGERPSDEMRTAWHEARTINQAVREAVAPGVAVADVARAAAAAQPADYTPYLRGLYAGYTTGIAYHNLLFEQMMSTRAAWELEPGMVVSLFGCSARDGFAVACIDPVLITDDGFEDLSRLPTPEEPRVVGR